MPVESLIVDVTVTNRDGSVFRGVAELDLVSKEKPGGKLRTSRSKTKKSVADATAERINLSLPLRNFIKEYSKGMGGAQRFTLLLAKMCGGKVGTPIDLKTLGKTWSKMKALIGKYNGAHATRAKDYGWVDSPKTGSYVLTASWKGIFEG